MKSHHDGMEPDDSRNLLIFIIAAIVVWVTFDHFLLKPKMQEIRAAQQAQQAALRDASETIPVVQRPREEVIHDTARIRLENGKITGSIALQGGRIDDVILNDYFKTLQQRENIALMSPAGSYYPRYASFGWTVATGDVATPDSQTLWRVQGGAENAVLRPEQPVTLYWQSPQGLRFERIITLDENFLFSVTQRVVNETDRSVTLFPYSLINQQGLPEDLYGRWVIHEGPIGYIDNDLIEISYKNMQSQRLREVRADEGWIALTERYWLTALFPDNRENNTFRFAYIQSGHRDVAGRFQVDLMGRGETLRPGEETSSLSHIYVGPKKLDVLEAYERQLNLRHVDLTIDFGMYYFMTKPLFYLLQWLGSLVGNFGVGILLLTLLVRTLVFPLANKSYRSFAGLRKVAPKMQEIREKHLNDKAKMQQELVKLYEKEKVNPMAGCLPILVQIPIFFALFKVLQISIEMRHAPFFGWIQDLSAPDPTSIFNLFGLLPWSTPGFLTIGIWPCLMLVFMILQKKMNPPPQDKMQKVLFDILPFVFVFIMARFASGLVIYWTFSAALGVVQQYIIMKSMGVEPELFKSKAQKEEERKMREAGVHPARKMIEDEVEEALFGEGDEQSDKTASKPATKKDAPKTGAKKAGGKKAAATADKAKETETKKPVSRPKPKKSKKKK